MEFLEILGLIGVGIVGLMSCIWLYMIVYSKLRLTSQDSKDIASPLDLKTITARHNEEMKYVEGSQKVIISNLRSNLAAVTSSADHWKRKLDKINKNRLNDSTIEVNSIEHLQANYDIDPVKASDYMKKLGLNPGVLTNPALAEEGWKRLHENKLAAMALGVLVPKGQEGGVVPLTDIFKNNKNKSASPDDVFDDIDVIVEKMDN